LADDVADDVASPWPIEDIPDEDHVFQRVLFPFQAEWVDDDSPSLVPTKAVIRNTGEHPRRGMSCNWSRYRPDPAETRAPVTPNPKYSVDQYGVVKYEALDIRTLHTQTERFKQDVKHDPDQDNRSHSLAVGPKSSGEALPDYEITEIRNRYASKAQWVIQPEKQYWPEMP
jgi:hypothetical protein